jgi:carbon monoxide dehydrogenase subunit G
MVSVLRTFTVHKPVPVVVDYLKDFAHTEQWDPGTKTCTRSDEGPIAVGARWHNVSEFRGRETELDYRLDRLDADHLVFTGNNKTATSTDDLTFSDSGDGTQVTYRATIAFHGLARLADPFLKSGFETLADETVKTMSDTLNELPG